VFTLICKLAIENEQGRKERMELLRKKIQVANQLRQKNLLKEHELRQLKLDIEEFSEIERIERCRYSVLEFAFEFFSADLNSDHFEDCFIPEGMSIKDAPEVHRDLCSYLDKVSYSTTGEKMALSLPRGMAKSSYVSQLFPIYLQCFRLEVGRFQVILSETSTMARRFLDYSRNALKHHERLQEHFGIGLEKVARLNDRDNADSYVSCFRNPETRRYTRCMVLASGIGGQLRGIKFFNHRVSILYGDDIESKSNTHTAEQRESTKNFWNTVIEPIGSPTSSFILIGTQLHEESLLNDIMKRPSYFAKSYSAIVKEPGEKSLEHWNRFEEIYRDLDNENREADAEAYFEEHKFTMTNDVETLWNRYSYKDLMKLKVEIGQRAFMSEYLNLAPSSSGVVFQESDFIYYDEEDLPSNLEKYTFWDIALTDKTTSDYNAIVTIARSKKGILYVIEARIFKSKMHIALNTAYEQAIKHRPRIFGIETIQAQTEVLRQFNSLLIQRGVYKIRTKGIRPRGKKQARIETLQPLIENGTLRFRKADRLLIEQLIGYPNISDDGPDALQQCINLIKFKRGHLMIPR
jgi:predicted phage terminase large subunit-like protein